MKIAENGIKLAILEADFMIDLTRSDSDPYFGFYVVEIFTGFDLRILYHQRLTFSPVIQ